MSASRRRWVVFGALAVALAVVVAAARARVASWWPVERVRLALMAVGRGRIGHSKVARALAEQQGGGVVVRALAAAWVAWVAWSTPPRRESKGGSEGGTKVVVNPVRIVHAGVAAASVIVLSIFAPPVAPVVAAAAAGVDQAIPPRIEVET